MASSLNLDEPLLKPDELAKILNVTRATVYRMVDRRSIPFHKVARCLRFHRQEIIEFLEKNKIDVLINK